MYILEIPIEILAAGFEDVAKMGKSSFMHLGDFYRVNKQHGLVTTKTPLLQLNSFLFLLLFKYMCRYL